MSVTQSSAVLYHPIHQWNGSSYAAHLKAKGPTGSYLRFIPVEAPRGEVLALSQRQRGGSPLIPLVSSKHENCHTRGILIGSTSVSISVALPCHFVFEALPHGFLYRKRYGCSTILHDVGGRTTDSQRRFSIRLSQIRWSCLC